MTKLNFESFDLKIDGIAFNIDTQDFDTIQMIANYLAVRPVLLIRNKTQKPSW